MMAIDKREDATARYILFVNPDTNDTLIHRIGDPAPKRMAGFERHSAYKCYSVAQHAAMLYRQGWTREAQR